MKSLKVGILMVSLLLMVGACDYKKDENKVIQHESGSNTTIIDDENEGADTHISVGKIDKYENMEISDWLDEETVIVSKENESLNKMSLLELSKFYPRSLYAYNLNTKEYKLLKEKENLFLGGATLSADKKHLLYHENSLGDPGFYVLSMDTLEGFGLNGDEIGGAVTANWEGNEVLGTTYSNKAFIANTKGEISILEEIQEDSLYVVRRIKDHFYYNTFSDETLKMQNMTSKETQKLNLMSVYNVIPSPDESMMLIIQGNGTKMKLILCDLDGNNQRTIAEGTEITGVSWSPDMRMIAYNVTEDVNGLYVYDLLSDESHQIAVDLQNVNTFWSPLGEKLVYSEWNGEQYNSSIVHLEFSVQN